MSIRRMALATSSAVGTTDRGAEPVVHRGRDAPAEHDRAEEVGRERVVDVERLERDDDDECLPDPPHRPGEVRRRDDDHRDDDREPDGGEARCVGEVEGALDRLPERAVAREEREQPTDDPAGGTRDDEVAGEPPPADEDRADREQADGPDREDLVAEEDERPPVARKVGDVADEVPFDTRRMLRVRDEPRNERGRDEDAHEVPGPAPARAIDVAADHKVPDSSPRGARRLIRQRCALPDLPARRRAATVAGIAIGVKRSLSAVSSAASSSVSSRSAASTLWRSWSTELAPGMATTFGLPDQPRERDLRRRRVVRGRNPAQRVDERARTLEVLGEAQRVVHAGRPTRRVGGVVPAAEHALRERAVRDDDAVVRLRVRDVARVVLALDQVEAHLVREHRAPERALGGGPAASPRSCSRRRA